MLGIYLKFDESEALMIANSFDELTKNMSTFQKALFQITRNKINNHQKPLDGMDMRSMEKALLLKSTVVTDVNAHNKLIKLAKRIEKMRLQFQYSATKERRAALGI